MTNIPPSGDAELEQIVADMKAITSQLERQAFARSDDRARSAYLRTAVRYMKKATDFLMEQMGSTTSRRSPF